MAPSIDSLPARVHSLHARGARGRPSPGYRGSTRLAPPRTAWHHGSPAHGPPTRSGRGLSPVGDLDVLEEAAGYPKTLPVPHNHGPAARGPAQAGPPLK